MLASTLKQLAFQTASELGSIFEGNRKWPSSPLSFLELANKLSLSADVAALAYALRRIYIDDEALLRSKLETLARMSEQFERFFGDGPVEIMRAPARVNILGEHIDYVSYLPTVSLTFGSLEHDMIMLFRPNETGEIRGRSINESYPSFKFLLSEGPTIEKQAAENSDSWLDYLLKESPAVPHWRNYAMGSVFFARQKYGAKIRTGYDFIIDSSLPPSGGASSSSALTVLTGAAIRRVNNITSHLEELARDSAKAEWFIGTRGGAMDHLAICLARKDHALRTPHNDHEVSHVPLRDQSLRWVTFFTHPAEKGSRVMLEYNERAFVSRLLIPALIDAWKTTEPERAKSWGQALSLYRSEPVTAIPLLQDLLNNLPEAVTLSEIKDLFPDVFASGARLFPGLFAQAESRSLKVRSRALHHLGEIERVNRALQILNQANDENEQPEAMTADTLGLVLSESHRSLRDLYEVSTSEIEELRRIILQDKKVHGARMMGGGFGGTILTLTSAENVPALIELGQTKFYGSRSRHALQEKSIMVSTPGAGLVLLEQTVLWREAIAELAGHNKAALINERTRFNSLLDAADTDQLSPEIIQPIIVAAGGGTRAAASGLLEPKPLALVNGQPSIKHVLENLRAAAHYTRPPIVIVAPENESQIRLALADEEVIFVVQPLARGTGDAVWWTKEILSDFNGLGLVVWSTQPVITPLTIKRTLKLATLCRDEYAMIFPTALKEHPYAPLYRDDAGQVTSSRESHLESARRPDFGETNLGLFVLQSKVMLAALEALHTRFWNSAAGRYERPRGELGFPNELIDYFVGHGASLLACPLADPREEQGIKTSADITLCEQYISELK